MKFRASGGTYWQLRQVREGRKREIETRAKEVEGQLQTLAAGELPLALVSGLLRQVEHQDVQERLAAQAGVVVELLGERDGRLIERLEQARVSGKTIELVRAFLDGDREERQHAMGAEPRLGLSQRAHAQLHHLGGPRLGAIRHQAEDLIKTHAALVQELDDLERGIETAPGDEEIGQVVEQFKAAAGRFSALQTEAKNMDDAIAALEGGAGTMPEQAGEALRGRGGKGV